MCGEHCQSGGTLWCQLTSATFDVMAHSVIGTMWNYQPKVEAGDKKQVINKRCTPKKFYDKDSKVTAGPCYRTACASQKDKSEPQSVYIRHSQGQNSTIQLYGGSGWSLLLSQSRSSIRQSGGHPQTTAPVIHEPESNRVQGETGPQTAVKNSPDHGDTTTMSFKRAE